MPTQFEKMCSKCRELRPLSQFSNNKRMPDGKCVRCKNCESIRKSEYFQRNKTRVIAKNREWRLNHREREAELQRLRNALNPEKKAERQRKYNARHRKEHSARTIANQALKIGLIKKQVECQQCGRSGYLHKHHSDYSKPLQVTWLCPICHFSVHVKGGDLSQLSPTKSFQTGI